MSEPGNGFYREFSTDCDLNGNSLSYQLRHVLTDAMVTGRAFIGCDFPKVNQVPTSLLEEEEIGANRAYLYNIPTLSVIDWDQDDFGAYRYVVLKRCLIQRPSVRDQRKLKTIEFKVWEKDSNSVSYTIYRITLPVDKEPNHDDECQEVESGTVSFTEIPILCMHLPTQLFVGALIGNLVVDHFKLNSSLTYALNRNLYALPVYQQGAEFPAAGDLSEKGTDPNRGHSSMSQMKRKGFAVIGPKDEIYFAEPEGKVYELVNTRIKEKVDEIHRVVNQMGMTIAQTNKKAQGSGLSKQMDNRSKELVLSAYAAIVKQFATRIYNLISEARKEDIIWNAMGMDDFHMVDRAILLQEATTMNLINIPSKTWKKHNLTRIAFELDDNLTPEVQLTIKNEIAEAIDKMPEEALMPVLDNDTNIEEDEAAEED